MKINDELKEVMLAQDGYMTTKQAIELGGLSRQSLYQFARYNTLDKVAHSIYKFKYAPEGENDELIVQGLLMKRRGAISHLSALAYHNMSIEIPYSIFIEPMGGITRHQRRALDLNNADVSLIKNDFPLDESECWALGDVLITSPERTVFDCVVGNLMQVESVQELIDNGQFNVYQLKPELQDVWANLSIVQMLDSGMSPSP